jgi:hypothetical protein
LWFLIIHFRPFCTCGRTLRWTRCSISTRGCRDRGPSTSLFLYFGHYDLRATNSVICSIWTWICISPATSHPDTSSDIYLYYAPLKFLVLRFLVVRCVIALGSLVVSLQCHVRDHCFPSTNLSLSKFPHEPYLIDNGAKYSLLYHSPMSDLRCHMEI